MYKLDKFGKIIGEKTKKMLKAEQNKDKLEANRLDKYQMSHAADYVNKIKFDVDVSELYKIIDSCHYNVDNKFCPIIVKLGKHMENLRQEGRIKKKHLKDFMLQVWDRDGRLVYERQLNRPVRNWGTFGDVLVFSEEKKPGRFFLL